MAKPKITCPHCSGQFIRIKSHKCKKKEKVSNTTNNKKRNEEPEPETPPNKPKKRKQGPILFKQSFKEEVLESIKVFDLKIEDLESFNEEVGKTHPKTEEQNIQTSNKERNTSTRIANVFKLSEIYVLQLLGYDGYVRGEIIELVDATHSKSIAKMKLLDQNPPIEVYIKHFTQKNPRCPPFDTMIHAHMWASRLYIELSFAGKCLRSIWLRTESEIIKTITQLLVEVGLLHCQKVIHNDIKRNNIVLYNGFTKLIDFEIYSDFDRYDEEEQICYYFDKAINTKAGTPNYLPPEKEPQGSGYITPKSDIYSLGIVFSELFTSSDISISDKMKEMIDGMKMEDPKDRWSIRQCIKHLKEYNIISKETLDEVQKHHTETTQLNQAKFKEIFIDGAIKKKNKPIRKTSF